MSSGQADYIPGLSFYIQQHAVGQNADKMARNTVQCSRGCPVSQPTVQHAINTQLNMPSDNEHASLSRVTPPPHVL